MSERRQAPRAASTCDFGCGPNGEECVTPGANIVPACPVHGWVCALLESREEAIRQLRDAWNAHMETCPQHAALPVLPAPTEDELRAWRDAPSGTASA